ncbi:fosmidomycin resistance protein [Halarchaeum acidiphilum MH1-52-1]|uniref:Fosmidomycin resistance protein n=1 Tax=Halarchaeum acidiphilum MH1-52-1 TaxID=1261545 RepID=U2YS75_9EURY|nr:MFS transporter [Halarchaeum acidiphilum]GAD51602.1 fosmidomycin resistance protein [Halarchaeum acidiphilum MH1-52-1]
MTRRASGPLGVTALVSADHFVSHVFLLALPPLFPLIAGTFDVSVTRLAVSVTLIFVAQFLCQVPSGELVDRVGGKRVVVGGLALTALSIGAAGFATSYLQVLACAFVSGIGQSPFHPANYALLDAAGDASSEGKQFSVHSFGGFVGFAAAPVLTTGIAALADWRTALIALGVAGLVYAGVLAVALAPIHRRVLRETAADDASNDGGSILGSVALLKRPLVAGMFAFFLLVTLSDTGMQTYTTAFAVNRLGLSTVVGNTALTAFLAVTAVFVLIGGWLADRYDVFTIIVVGLAWSALVLGVGVTLDLEATTFVAAWAVAGIGFGVSLPARDRITNALSGAEDTGKSFGLVYTGLPIGGALAPVVLGAVIARLSYFDAVVAIAVCFFLAAVVVAALRRAR